MATIHTEFANNLDTNCSWVENTMNMKIIIYSKYSVT